MRTLPETPNLRWFNPMDFNCRRCGKRADGELMGVTNENYGLHCRKCADRRLKLSAEVRDQLAAELARGLK